MSTSLLASERVRIERTEERARTSGYNLGETVPGKVARWHVRSGPGPGAGLVLVLERRCSGAELAAIVHHTTEASALCTNPTGQAASQRL
jgi:hypothetical protein